MITLFTLGLTSLVAPSTPVSLVLQITGFAGTAIYDPLAFGEGEAPRYFQRLRPVQMMIPAVSLALILAGLVARSSAG